MKTFAAGAALVILGGIVVITFKALGVSHVTSVTVGVSISVIGFVLQMYSAFNTKWKFEKEMRQAHAEHVAHMKEAAQLPPEEAISLLLKRIH